MNGGMIISFLLISFIPTAHKKEMSRDSTASKRHRSHRSPTSVFKVIKLSIFLGLFNYVFNFKFQVEWLFNFDFKLKQLLVLLRKVNVNRPIDVDLCCKLIWGFDINICQECVVHFWSQNIKVWEPSFEILKWSVLVFFVWQHYLLVIFIVLVVDLMKKVFGGGV